MAEPGIFHWSKDFVEHLRVVHFSIALTAIVLMVTAFNRQDARLAAALTQIESIAAFEKHWKEVPLKVFHQALEDQRLDHYWSSSLEVAFSKGLYPGNNTATFFHISEQDIADSIKGQFAGLDMPEQLDNLHDFEAFWNRAHGGFRVPLPKKIDKTPGCDELLLVNWSDGSADRIDDISAELNPGLPVAECSVGTGLMAALSGPRLAFTTSIYIADGLDLHTPLTNGKFMLTFDLPPQAIKFQKQGRKIISAKSESDFPVDIATYNADEKIFTKLFFGGNRVGGFDAVFPELKAESNGIEFLDISEAVHRIESKPSSAPQNLSLLGITVPLADISLWGILVLVGTQLYLLLHLRELTARISPDAEGWNVAWIGVYQTRLSSAMTILSACILPDAVAIILGYRAVTSSSNRWLVTGFILLVLIGVLVSVVTVLKLRQLRLVVSLSNQANEPNDIGPLPAASEPES